MKLEVTLTEDEIRKILADKLAEGLDHVYEIDPDNCWFECEAGENDGDNIGDIHDVRFVVAVNRFVKSERK